MLGESKQRPKARPCQDVSEDLTTGCDPYMALTTANRDDWHHVHSRVESEPAPKLQRSLKSPGLVGMQDESPRLVLPTQDHTTVRLHIPWPDAGLAIPEKEQKMGTDGDVETAWSAEAHRYMSSTGGVTW